MSKQKDQTVEDPKDSSEEKAKIRVNKPKGDKNKGKQNNKNKKARRGEK